TGRTCVVRVGFGRVSEGLRTVASRPRCPLRKSVRYSRTILATRAARAACVASSSAVAIAPAVRTVRHFAAGRAGAWRTTYWLIDRRRVCAQLRCRHRPVVLPAMDTDGLFAIHAADGGRASTDRRRTRPGGAGAEPRGCARGRAD